jgi:hypothetical protein
MGGGDEFLPAQIRRELVEVFADERVHKSQFTARAHVKDVGLHVG